eukprot:CAMPEP_0113515418 /NCGR_PEP_ID=MMETSP0014_2-20120614/40939_1 /TAXON_ID=2857 /ORGANISM="Nitzschia sp." /LENGTH=115 /DNA_ID=CAMNT_0000411995 /DNA_START=544 /DNA_END=892 /DNA_ORIENTATION=+ /assembly_acc=CAM_ASM_000159
MVKEGVDSSWAEQADSDYAPISSRQRLVQSDRFTELFEDPGLETSVVIPIQSTNLDESSSSFFTQYPMVVVLSRRNTPGDYFCQQRCKQRVDMDFQMKVRVVQQRPGHPHKDPAV